MLFISHANPEDNDFSLWLALKLAQKGYPVWCDLIKLLGGEDFWRDAEAAIRDAHKFLFVLSTASNMKDGTRLELHTAKNVAKQKELKDFIIPLKIDDLPHADINIELSNLNTIPFLPSWAEGLNQLLKKLDLDKVPRNPAFDATIVSQWWSTNKNNNDLVIDKTEDYLSNEYRIQNLPKFLYFHSLHRRSIGPMDIESKNLSFPGFVHGKYLVSFAPAEDFSGSLGSWYITETESFKVNEFLSNAAVAFILPWTERTKGVTRLLRLGWEAMLKSRGLTLYEMANEVSCYYVANNLIPKNWTHFEQDDEPRRRRVVGRIKAKPKTTEKRYWHFGVDAKVFLSPEPAYTIRPHVLFSDDGSTIWTRTASLHSWRRRVCRMWFNEQWRDRIAGIMSWLAAKDEAITINLGSQVIVSVSKTPLTYSSPVSINDDEVSARNELERRKKNV